MKLKVIAAFAGLTALAAVSISLPAQATTIDFTGAGAANYDDVSNSYGDSAEADLNYRSLNGGNNWGQFATQLADHAEYWNDANYSHDNAIFTTTSGNKLEVALHAGAGLKFTSVTFDLGSYPDVDRPIAYRLFDAGWNELLNNPAFVVSGTSAGGLVTLAVNSGSLYFQMGDDWDVGVRSLSFTTAAVATTPIPAALPLFASGLGILGWAARRKRQKANTTV
jgi:hypothetical protein